MKGEKKRCFNTLWVINTYSWIFFNFSACCCNSFNQLWHIQVLCDHANVNTVLLPSEFWTWGHRERQVLVLNKSASGSGNPSPHPPAVPKGRICVVQTMQAKKVQPWGFSDRKHALSKKNSGNFIQSRSCIIIIIISVEYALNSLTFCHLQIIWFHNHRALNFWQFIRKRWEFWTSKLILSAIMWHSVNVQVLLIITEVI